MKKMIITLSLMLNVACIFFVGLLFVSKYLGHNKEAFVPTNKQRVQTYKIAVLTPVTHKSLEAIEEAFKKTVTTSDKNNYTFDVFNAHGSMTLMRAQAEEIVQGSYDLIFTIATQPTQLMKEICAKRNKPIPLVFAAVDEPERLGIVSTLAKPGGLVTGVYESFRPYEQIMLLKMLRPTIKNLLLVYHASQGGGLERQKQEYEKVCVGYGITLHIVEVFNVNEVYTKAASSIQGVDAMLVLKDNTVVPAIDGLIKLCLRRKITIMASDLDSGDKGAALSFGVYEDQFGIQAARFALKILDDKIAVGDIPCVDAGQFKLKINMRAATQQGLVLTQEQLLLYKSVIVV